MEFQHELLRGRLIKRYKRFLADIVLDGGATVTASCPNTGSMMGLTAPGSLVWVSTSESATRKYKHRLEMIENDAGSGPVLVGINTGHPNAIVAAAIDAGRVKAIKGYSNLRREQKYGQNSRIDILLDCPNKGTCYVEVKNVTLMLKKGEAAFPDAVTARGTKHLAELTDMVRAGHRAVMLYLIQRADATCFAIARDIDPAYGAAFERARAAGVEAIALRCRVSPKSIEIDRAVRIID